MAIWEIKTEAERAWLETWEAEKSPTFPGNFDEFVAMKNTFLENLERRLTQRAFDGVVRAPFCEHGYNGLCSVCDAQQTPPRQ